MKIIIIEISDSTEGKAKEDMQSLKDTTICFVSDSLILFHIKSFNFSWYTRCVFRLLALALSLFDHTKIKNGIGIALKPR